VTLRRHRLEHSVEHLVSVDGADRLLILHNDGAENFELASASLQALGLGRRSCGTGPIPGCSAAG